MNRRMFLKASLSGLAMTALPHGVRAAKGRPSRPPNFVIIFTDDQGYQDLGCYGTQRFKTPHVDGMAAKGMRFTDFYSASPVCTPARAALLSGCYPPRIGMHRVLFPGSRTGLNPEEQLLPSVLKGAGYTTACIGKWHLGSREEFFPTSCGFDEFFGLPYSNDMISADQPGGREGATYPPLPLIDGTKTIETNPDQRLLTRRYTEKAVDFIRRQAEQPFFLYLAHTMPHVPVFASDAFSGRSGAGKYGDAMEEIDWSTGEILRTLRELGLERDTVIVFTSDNGPWLRSGKYGELIPEDEEGCAEPLRGGKFTTYEGGMRVPCVMYGPGRIAPGTVCRDVCATIDLLPTLAGMAGVSLREDLPVDGRDIAPLLAATPGARSPHDCFYYFRGNRLEAVRRGGWKLRKTSSGRPPTERLELYDLEHDVGETRNLADENPEQVQSLQEAMEAFESSLKGALRPCGKL